MNLNSNLEILQTIPVFSLENLETRGRIIGVYDGDSCDIVLEHENNLKHFKCRINGIDCAEKRSKNPDERLHAIKARDFVENWARDKILDIKCGEFDKYGRLLVELSYNGEDLVEKLVENGLAYRYTGGTKMEFGEW